MRRLTAFAHDHRRLVIGLWIAAVLAAGGLAAGAGGTFVNNFNLPGTESQRATDLLEDRFPQQAADSSQIVFRSAAGSLRSAERRTQVQRVVKSVAGLPAGSAVAGPYAGAGQISRDGRTAFATLQFDKQANALDKADVTRVVDTARSGAGEGLQVNLGGQAIQYAEQPESSATEGIGILVAIAVLIATLGSLAAMTMPLIVAFAAIAVGVSLVTVASSVFDIADFAPTLAVMIALGVGIDYALLIINRFRAERGQGSDVREATLTAMDTAGRSVLFAGATVVIALLGMLTLSIGLLNGPAVAAALAVALTMVGSLTLLPALLGAFGRRVKVSRNADPDTEPRGWSRWSRFVERRAGILAVAAIALLLLVASPAMNLNFGVADAGNNSPSTTTRQAYDQLSEGFGAGFNGPLLVVAGVQDPATRAKALTRLESSIRRERGVAAVTPATLNPARDTAVFTVFPDTKREDQGAKDLLNRLGTDWVPAAAPARDLRGSIGGSTAAGVDISSLLASKLP